MKTRLGWIDVVAYLAYLLFAALAVLFGQRGALWYAGLCLVPGETSGSWRRRSVPEYAA